MTDEQQGTPEQPADPRERARQLLRRTAPVLRDVNARIEQDPNLRDTRDALVDRAGGLVKKADEQLRKLTAIEGTVVERDGDTSPTSDASSTSAATPPRADTTDGERQPHWTKERVARMATAAAREAVRPHKPLVTREAKWALLCGAVFGVFAATVMRRRR